MKAQPKIYGRVDGNKWVPVQQSGNGKYAAVAGATAYYIRYTLNGKRHATPAGKTLETAYPILKNIESRVEAPELAPAPIANPDRKTVDGAAQIFFAEIKTLGKSKGTIGLYKNAVMGFRKSCLKAYLDQITRTDIVEFITWIETNVPEKGDTVGGGRNNTIRNYLRYLTVFFSNAGITNPLPPKEWPKEIVREPKAFSTEELQELLAVATPDEKLLIHAFVYTGFRDAEIQYLEYSDFDFKNHSVNIGPKPHLNWKTKNQKPRPIRVPVPPEFAKAIANRRDARKNSCSLVFPNSLGTHDDNIILKVRAVARRADWSLSQVEEVGMHKFRKTFATLYSKKFPPQTIQKLLGHTDIQTTMRYLAADNLNTAASKELVSEVFAGI
jgi:integrase